MTKPLIIAVAPNGARHSKADIQQLPITPRELAYTAERCVNQGATMIHLHVRDADQKHTLEPEFYRPAIAAVSEAVKDRMLIQVTTEAAGVYKAHEQIGLTLQLMPDFVSIGLREYISKDSDYSDFSDFIRTLYEADTLIQYILYDQNDYRLYQRLIAGKVIPTDRHSLLIVIGRYLQTEPSVSDLSEYDALLSAEPDSMVCTFGSQSPDILHRCAAQGLHIRLGFENSRRMSNHSDANFNDQLVADFASLQEGTRDLATYEQTLEILGG